VVRGLRPAFLLSAAVLGLAGCGGGESDEADAGGGGGGANEITLADYSIDPARIDVDEAGEVTLSVRNDGDVAHALTIGDQSTGTLGPGETAQLTVDLGAGTYRMLCPVGNHSEQGMEGTLIVAGGGAGGGTTTGEDEDTGGYGYG
jgi:plastocyanin